MRIQYNDSSSAVWWCGSRACTDATDRVVVVVVVVVVVEGVVEGLGRGDLARSSRVDVRASPRESGLGARLARRGAQT
jgi:hypothetical protein